MLKGNPQYAADRTKRCSVCRAPATHVVLFDRLTKVLKRDGSILQGYAESKEYRCSWHSE